MLSIHAVNRAGRPNQRARPQQAEAVKETLKGQLNQEHTLSKYHFLNKVF